VLTVELHFDVEAQIRISFDFLDWAHA
jgi:hypothetical protein